MEYSHAGFATTGTRDSGDDRIGGLVYSTRTTKERSPSLQNSSVDLVSVFSYFDHIISAIWVFFDLTPFRSESIAANSYSHRTSQLDSNAIVDTPLYRVALSKTAADLKEAIIVT